MRKLGKPAIGQERRLTSSESLATGLSRANIVRNRENRIFVFYREAYVLPKLADGKFIAAGRAIRILGEYWNK